MRQLSKWSLLVAPILFSAATGCSLQQGALSGPDAIQQSREDRSSKLLSVAEKYERDGKPELACRIYEHVLERDPRNQAARQRLDLLAHQGINSGRRAAPAKTDGQSSSARELLAVIEQRQSQSAAAPMPTDKPKPAPVSHESSSPVQVAAATSEPAVERKPVVHKAAIVHAESEESSSEADPFADSFSGSAGRVEQAVVQNSEGGSWHSANSQAAATVAPAAEPAPPAQPAAPPKFVEERRIVTSEPRPTVVDPLPTIRPAPRNEGAATASTVTPGQELSPGQELQSDFHLITAEQPTIGVQPSSPASFISPDPGSKDSFLPATADPNPESDAWKPTRLVTLCDDLPDELYPYVNQLESNDPAERIAGLMALGSRGTAARPATVAVHALLEDADPLVAVYAAGTLRDVANDAWSCVKTLAAHLNDQDEEVVRLSAYLLGRMGPEAMDAVGSLEKLRDSRRGISSLHAAEALIHVAPDDRRSLAMLTAALTHRDRKTRWFAAVALGTATRQCGSLAVPGLVSALHDQEAEVRAAAALSLGGLGENAQVALPDLQHLAAHDEPEVRFAAETALACLRE